MAGLGMRVGAACVGIARPSGGRNRVEALAQGAAELLRNLIDRKACKSRLALRLHLASEAAAEIALDQGATEGADVVSPGSGGVDRAVKLRLLGKFLGAIEAQVDFVGKA